MRLTLGGIRTVGTGAMVVLMAVAISGCMGGKVREDFAKAPDQRPLEIPPPLQVGEAVPEVVTASQMARPSAPRAQGSNVGFTVQGAREPVFADVGRVLAAMEGVKIVSRAEVLGSYDVSFEGSNFLIRVVDVESGVYVTAMDARGQPALGPSVQTVLSALKVALVP